MTIFEITVFGIRIAPTYYGLAYALGILGAYSWIGKRGKFNERELDILLYSMVGGIILGGRLGYVLFYNLPYYLAHPAKILAIYEGGMSFHGGIIGVTIAILLFAWRQKRAILEVADEVAVLVPLGIFLGRIANYLNGELYGYVPYSGPFPIVKDGVAHFPSPLLESLLEGVLLGGILVFLQKKGMKPGVISSVFLMGYAIARMFVEAFFRLPDAQIGYIFGGQSLGFWLSVGVFLFGLSIFEYIQVTSRLGKSRISGESLNKD